MKRGGGLSLAQKQAFIDNLQLESMNSIKWRYASIDVLIWQ